MTTLTQATQIVNFTFEQSPIRIIDQNGEFWFVANDVCGILEVQNTTQALQSLDDDEKSKLDTTSSPMLNIGLDHRAREINIINESGLYALILRSRKAMQKGTVQHKFRKWVTSEVLPSIRKTGQYRHTISTEQQAQIQKAVRQKCQSNSTHYQTVYTALKDKFGVPSYKDILAADFESALAFIMGFEFAPALNIPFIQNILSDNAHQNRKAQDELSQMMVYFGGALDHLQELKHRLEISERCIRALQNRFIA
ncbi:BRO family protein [Moraxella bovoculi]|uniref:BRO family protein n=1 Tax=Moraxella bovoculi TaxID=386891 RepID=UPI0009BA3BE3|nr:BRO family protein [Moraxella bovoculi]